MSKAPKGCLWVCMACGKTSEDKKVGVGEGSRGWDVSCFLHAHLVEKEHITSGEDGRVVEVLKIKEEES